MSSEEQPKNIYQRINAVMEGTAKVIKEDKKVNGQYSYVSHDAVTRILHPLFRQHGILMRPSVVEAKQDGNRCELMVEVAFINVDNPVDNFSVNAVGHGIDSQDKGPGKALSYAVKMACLKVLMIESGEPDDKGPADPDNECDVTTDHQKAKGNGGSAEWVLTDKPVPKEYWDSGKSWKERDASLLGGLNHAARKNPQGKYVIAYKEDVPF